MRTPEIRARYNRNMPGRIIGMCLIVILALAHLYDPATVLAQSAIIQSGGHQSRSASIGNAIPNSLTSDQLRTEAMLSRSISAFGLGQARSIPASEVFKRLGVTVYIDLNLEGIFDEEDELNLRSGVSMAVSLHMALRLHDATAMVEPDGSILVLSIDDENEPDYLRTVTYDITRIANNLQQARTQLNVLQNTIDSDSWEQNGGGNGSIAIQQVNGRMLASVSQSYRVHRRVRAHFDSIAFLGGTSSLVSPVQRQQFGQSGNSSASSVVQVHSSLTATSNRFQIRSTPYAKSGREGFSGGVF
ncbi:hypothetical protein [Mariniblastus fucicola]|uniref:Uncharacterized protein n=1 Tax=Mariniblastus fucicola TaxID=980251 RepID=A0A5B9P8J4_9BACT|nr:hypothetical protein [Mariniblastus fucicola]QEG22674.1 hypothetical protein MFFC18_25570 [Mariniblastus fucicola]